MTITAAVLAIAAIALSGHALAPAESVDAGKRVESDSYTAPTKIARCITYNIGKKRPDLRLRSRIGDTSDEATYLILTSIASPPATVAVIRVEQGEAGSHLTTWFPSKTLAAAPAEVAHRLIAGC